MAEQRLSDLDFAELTNRPFFPSPAAWEDQVLYFLMLDRFSDGNEQGYRDNDGNVAAAGTTPLFDLADTHNATRTEKTQRRGARPGLASSAGRCRGSPARSAICSGWG